MTDDIEKHVTVKEKRKSKHEMDRSHQRNYKHESTGAEQGR